jgi:hypothetical protein
VRPKAGLGALGREGEMEKYQFDENVFAGMEECCIPFAVYQFIEKRVYTLALSQGFLDVFGFQDRAEAYYVMDNDMYRDAHPDDVARIADAALRFATEGGIYNVVYRTKPPADDEYMIIHSQGRHVFTETGVRLAVVWYTPEGSFGSDNLESAEEDILLNGLFGRMLREESSIHESRYDNLTGLPNMAYFFDLADAGRAALQARGEHTAVIYFDLADMKAFNTKHGYAEGDALLRAVAKVLVNQFSNENCARFGQDHFAVYATTAGLGERLNRVF